MTTFLIYSEPLPSGWEWNPEKPLTGTEEFYVRTAEETLRADPKGEVLVIHDGPTLIPEGWDERLTYLNRDYAEDVIPGFDPDVVLLCNPQAEFTSRDLVDSTACPILYWSNRYEDEPEDISMSGCRIVISDFHKKQLAEHDINSVVVPHGVDHAKYAVTDAEFDDKEDLAIFTSAYDRGGRLLKDIWNRHRIQERTGVRLFVTQYGWDAHGGKEGVISDAEMTDLYKKAKWWLHPGQGVELFCMAGVKAQAASCTPIYVPNMALAETVKWGFASDRERYAENIVKILTSKAQVRANADHVPSWAEATRMLWSVKNGY